jgi:hypothetical protein
MNNIKLLGTSRFYSLLKVEAAGASETIVNI